MDHMIYTDGGCHNESGDMKGVGAYAFLEPTDLSNEYVIVYCGYVEDTTNNRTEMLAIINGLKTIDELDPDTKSTIHVVSDSGYVVKGYNDPAYLERWVANGWRTSTNKPASNKDLWEKIMELSWHIPFTMEMIRGHKKDKNHLHAFWNDICDKACTFTMENMKGHEEQFKVKYYFKTKKVEVV